MENPAMTRKYNSVNKEDNSSRILMMEELKNSRFVHNAYTIIGRISFVILSCSTLTVISDTTSSPAYLITGSSIISLIIGIYWLVGAIQAQKNMESIADFILEDQNEGFWLEAYIKTRYTQREEPTRLKVFYFLMAEPLAWILGFNIWLLFFGVL
jgi:hypothetical protein